MNGPFLYGYLAGSLEFNLSGWETEDFPLDPQKLNKIAEGSTATNFSGFCEFQVFNQGTKCVSNKAACRPPFYLFTGAIDEISARMARACTACMEFNTTEGSLHASKELNREFDAWDLALVRAIDTWLKCDRSDLFA